MTDDPKTHPHELISALLDGEATVPERAAVDRHLRDCGECRALLGDFRALAATAAAGQPPPVPAGLLAAVRARLEAAGERAGRPAVTRSGWRWTDLWRSPLPVAAAAGVMVAVAALWTLRESDRPALHAPPSGPITTKEEAGADTAIPGEAESVAIAPERKQVLPPPKPPPSRAPAVLSPTASEMFRQEPPPSPEIGKTAGPLEAGEAARSAEPSGFARSKENLAQDVDQVLADARKQMAASPQPKAAREPAAAVLRAGEGRELRFEFPGYSGSITEGGTIAIREGEFRCTARVGDSPGIRAEIASLFSLASSSGTEGAAQENAAAGAAGQGGEQGRVSRRISVSLPGRGAAQPGPSHDLPPATAGEIGRRIDGLIQGPLRATLKDQCGRLPGAGGHEPAD
jgi:anti-sigma factor RsiW